MDTGPLSRRDDVAQHWATVYETREVSQTSWFEPTPETSVRMLDAAGVTPGMSVIDIGAGASPLAGELIARGFTDVTALDVADEGLAAARARLGPAADQVHWMQADLRGWTPNRRFDVWHDRAVFHFLTDPADQARYRTALDCALAPEGRLVIATFAADGPDRCSGLPTVRYSPEELLAVLGEGRWDLITQRREAHRTPGGAVQPFTWLALRRRATQARG
jgi:SAM-dependent methyltransferase